MFGGHVEVATDGTTIGVFDTGSARTNPLRQQLTAATEGREVFLGQEQAGA